jgi:hypothetical protein
MLGPQVQSDLGLDKIHSAVPTQLPWGAAAFTKGLTDLSADPAQLRKRQLPLLALKANRSVAESAAAALKELAPHVESIDRVLQRADEKDPLRTESIGQILFSKDSPGAFLNTRSAVINGLVTWKTLVLPGFAILTPLLGLLVPFFVLRYLQPSLAVPDYLEQVRATLLKQVSIPSFARPRGDNDVVGFVLQSCFIGLTLVMFISGLWNQVSTALYLRSVWRSLQESGSSLKALVSTASRLLSLFSSTDGNVSKGLCSLVSEGQRHVTVCADFESAADISAFGAVWNNGEPLSALRDWIGRVDVYVSLSLMRGICLPVYTHARPSLTLRKVVHPLVQNCISNNYDSSSPKKQHVILTGPNRGGKSTFCKSVGLSIVTAQSWGFAWASGARLTPFAAIHTALETQGRLGHASTFEAEIAFAKTVLADCESPAFVMMDEIFHSTNAVDGVEASRAFLTKLYLKQGAMSLISTHYRELAKLFESQADLLRMATTDGVDGSLVYNYCVESGVSDKSSVSEILLEHGLI